MTKKHNIMVVDDDPLMGGMICRFLSQKKEFNVRYFESPIQALTDVHKFKPDMVILDWSMPKLSGLQFLLRLRKNKKTKTLPVFMLTAKRRGEDFERACAAGVDGYITKPINFNMLNNHVTRYFSNV